MSEKTWRNLTCMLPSAKASVKGHTLHYPNPRTFWKGQSMETVERPVVARMGECTRPSVNPNVIYGRS